MTRKWALAALAAWVLSIGPAVAQGVPYFSNLPGSVLTRAPDTTAYTGSQTICLAKTVTPCAAGTINLPTTKGIINRVSLLKSGSTTTAASFIIWFYSAPPLLTGPVQFDAGAYTGPRAADMPNYLGNAACATATATSDTSAGVWFDCTLSNPNTAGAMDFAFPGSGTIYYLITVAASSAYAPANGETFTPELSGFF